MSNLVITGSAGRRGGRISRILADLGVSQRLLVRAISHPATALADLLRR